MRTKSAARLFSLVASIVALIAAPVLQRQLNANGQTSYQYEETRELVALVKDASELLRTKGEVAFTDFRTSGTRWRQGEKYIFVLDREGNMLVHPDSTIEGKNQLELKDINAKQLIRGLINTATALPTKTEGWYHYEWPVPGELLPRWKSTYVQLVEAKSGKSYIVGSGVYNDRMERAFVEDMVKDAVGQIEKNGEMAFQLFRDPTGPFMAKEAYIFVIDMNGIELVNPAFPNLEGRNLLDLKDTHGKQLIREMLKLIQNSGSGWVDYMWPKPGESVSTQKSSYVNKVKIGDKWLMVGAGVYLAEAPRATPVAKMTAAQLMTLVREGATVLEKQGENAFAEFRKKGSKWFRDDTYFFVWTMDGTRVFHAADARLEGRHDIGIKDVLGRPYGQMFHDVAASATGEGWVHYMYPEPGDIFPTWKSTFLKRIIFPSGKQYFLGSGIYNMQMDKAFIEDMVNRAAVLLSQQGKEAFAKLRDKKGPFVFMDTYVFVDTPDGIEVMNAAQPSLEGRNILDLKDVKGKAIAREYISTAMKDGKAWVEYYWYRPGQNIPARKQAYVRKVQSGNDIYIIGSGFYVANEVVGPALDDQFRGTAK